MKTRLDFLPPIVRFGIVGVIAYIVDAAVLLALSEVMQVVPARFVAFGLAVTTTFVLNHRSTFDCLIDESLFKSYVKYVSANSIGGVINLVVSTAILLQALPLLGMPLVALACGSLSGKVANNTLSKRYVFLSKERDA